MEPLLMAILMAVQALAECQKEAFPDEVLWAVQKWYPGIKRDVLDQSLRILAAMGVLTSTNDVIGLTGRGQVICRMTIYLQRMPTTLLGRG